MKARLSSTQPSRVELIAARDRLADQLHRRREELLEGGRAFTLTLQSMQLWPGHLARHYELTIPPGEGYGVRMLRIQVNCRDVSRDEGLLRVAANEFINGPADDFEALLVAAAGSSHPDAEEDPGIEHA